MENKIVTIYELIGLIKDNKAPKKVFYNGYEYKFCKDIGDYRRFGWEHCLIIKDTFEYNNQFHNSLYNMLNDIVEILPEENDEWKDIYTLGDSEQHHFMNRQNDMTQEDRRLLDSNFRLLGETINQLIKNQKYLKEKLEEK